MFETSPYPGRHHWCDLCHGHLGPGSPCAEDPPDEEPEAEPDTDQDDEEGEDDGPT